jgi:hypothetical protein
VHLAVGLWRHEGEEKLAGRAGDLPGALLAGYAAGTLVRVLGLQPGEHGADAIVEHGPEGRCSRAPVELRVPTRPPAMARAYPRAAHVSVTRV